MEPATQSQSTAPSRISATVRQALPAAVPLVAGLMLRLVLLRQFFEVSGDSLIYGGLAKNLLLHGRYALIANGEIYPTLIRLPGYPLFLALCFKVFGMENYAAAAWVQIPLELLGCLLLAACVRRIAPPAMARGTGLATLWLAALCPFTAVYAAEPLTESLTLFMLALALWALARTHIRPGWSVALLFTFAVTSAALLRPDGALVGIALAPAFLLVLMRSGFNRPARRKDNLLIFTGRERAWDGSLRRVQPPHKAGRISQPSPLEESALDGSVPDSSTHRHLSPIRAALVCTLLALAPFAVWTARNWSVFHVFQPLAPRYATDPGEDPHLGWENWVKTWCLDFVSTYDIYWNVPGGTLDLSKLPSRAFDSPAQYAETAAIADDYNATNVLTPEIDQRFARLAQERTEAHPVRSLLWLPLGRLADMILRPRVENLPIDLDWWVYAHHHVETRFSWAYAGLNALYLLLALAGFCLRPRFWPWMLAYLVLRSALLLTIEAPETRYTLEFFPIVFALGGIGLWAGLRWLGKAAAIAGKLLWGG